jgi:hypothetical protein
MSAPSDPSPVPRVPRENRTTGDENTTFIDLDGDGVTDLASTTMSWLNTFRPPVIKGFPNGLAKNTVPIYKVITTADAQSDTARPGHPTYQDSTSGSKPLALASGTSFMTTPLRVVASLAADDGIGGTATTDYEYRDLRASPSGRGPQGFSHRHRDWATRIRACQPGHRTRIKTKTQYVQPFPYTGMPSNVWRHLVDSSSGTELALLSTTTTDYCDAMPGTGNSLYIAGDGG